MVLGLLDPVYENDEFDFETDDLTDLVLQETRQADLFVFRNTKTGTLVKHFVLQRQPQVMTMVTVNVFRRGEVLQANLTFRKHLRDVEPKRPAAEEVGADAVRKVKAQVSLDNNVQRTNFWRLVRFLDPLMDLQAPDAPIHVVGRDKADLLRLMGDFDRATVLETVMAVMGGRLNVEDIAVLTGRKAELEVFEKMLHDPVFFERERSSHGEGGDKTDGEERTWQKFFERNQWIFGYGLVLQSSEALKAGRLEQPVGTDAVGSGKRVDALMRTRGVIGGLLFAEIKKHTTDLVNKRPYRVDDVFSPSPELAGAIAQVQKTAAKALALMKPTSNTASGVLGEFAAVRPRQIVVIGHLSTVKEDAERYTSFEMFRRSLASDVEVLTFDELYERAKFILTTQS